MGKKEYRRILICTFMVLALCIASIWAQQSRAPQGQQRYSTYIRVLYPNGNEVIKTGSTYRITWNASLQTRSVGIRLENQQRRLIYNVVTRTSNTGAYLWKVPEYIIPAPGYVIKIYDVTRPSAYDVSDRAFTIVRGTSYSPTTRDTKPGWRPETEVIEVTSPSPYSRWYKKRTYYIRWEAPREIDYVNLFVSFDDGKTYSRIDLKVRARNDKFRWRLPDNLPSSPNARIKIVDHENPYYYGTSPRFAIMERDERITPVAPEEGYPTPTPRPTPTPIPRMPAPGETEGDIQFRVVR